MVIEPDWEKTIGKTENEMGRCLIKKDLEALRGGPNWMFLVMDRDK